MKPFLVFVSMLFGATIGGGQKPPRSVAAFFGGFDPVRSHPKRES